MPDDSRMTILVIAILALAALAHWAMDLFSWRGK